MPHDGAIIFSDLIGKLDMVRVTCEKCGRDGSYGLNRLIERRGRDAKLIDWIDELTADCPKKIVTAQIEGNRANRDCTPSRVPVWFRFRVWA